MREKLFTIRPRKGTTITLFQTGFDSRGAASVEVVVRDNGREVFGPGTDGMRLTGALSPLFSTDGIDAKRYALSYASIRPGDTDKDFFDPYTPAQLAWVEANGEELSMLTFARYGDD